MAKAAPEVIAESPLIEVRNSELHGLGVFATQSIKKGTRIIEYIGDQISHDEADRRYESKDDNDNHTFLFSVDRKLVIDAGESGNDARYFNHSCDPNCESVIEQRRVFIEAIKNIEPGDEMTYDYQIGRERTDPPNIDEIYACKCGAKGCRGTMLWPAKRPGRAKARKKATAQKKAVAGKKSAVSQVAAKGKRSGAQAKSSARAKSGGAATKGAGKKGAASKKGVTAKKGAAKKGAASQKSAGSPSNSKKKASSKGKRK
jgi:hypothetical protein